MLVILQIEKDEKQKIKSQKKNKRETDNIRIN